MFGFLFLLVVCGVAWHFFGGYIAEPFRKFILFLLIIFFVWWILSFFFGLSFPRYYR